jgi:hypothetical protein
MISIMKEEEKLTKLCAEHPGLKEAKESFDIMHTLCRNEHL